MAKETKKLYKFGPFELDPGQRLLLRQGRLVQLTPKAVDLLLVLVESGGRVISKDDLLQRVWPDSFVEEANLSHNVYKLREALGDGEGGEKYIETLPRRGYRFVAPVTDSVQQSAEPGDELKQSAPSTADKAKFTPPIIWSKAKRLLVGLGLLLIALAIVLAIRGRSGRSGPPETAPVRTIAVLPFRPIAHDSRDEILELGMADTLINRLASLPQLTVRPISAVRKYTDLQQDALAAGRELAVDTVLDGSIQRSGDQLRITVQLFRVNDGSSLWADKFNQKYTDIFAVQDAIAERVATALAVTLNRRDRERLGKRATGSTEAYQLYLLGRYHWNRATPESLARAVESFQQAIERDPQYALAYSGMAEAYGAQGLYGFLLPKEAFPRARLAAEKALSLDGSLAEPHAELAYVKFRYDWDYAGAEEEYKKAVALNPNDANGHYLLGEYLTVMQRYEEAAKEQARAEEIDPLSLPNRMMIAARFYFMRQFDQCIEELGRISDMDRNFVVAYDLLWAAQREKHNFADSVAARIESLRLQGYTHDELTVLRDAYAEKDVKAFWKKDAELAALPGHGQTAVLFIAMNYAQLGEKDSAFKWLGRAYAERNSWLPELKADPAWDNLRSDARFQALLQRVNLIAQ